MQHRFIDYVGSSFILCPCSVTRVTIKMKCRNRFGRLSGFFSQYFVGVVWWFPDEDQGDQGWVGFYPRRCFEVECFPNGFREPCSRVYLPTWCSYWSWDRIMGCSRGSTDWFLYEFRSLWWLLISRWTRLKCGPPLFGKWGFCLLFRFMLGYRVCTVPVCDVSPLVHGSSLWWAVFD